MRRSAMRRDAAPAICNATSEIVSGSVETRKNEFTVINSCLVRAIEFRSRNAGTSARAAKIIDDVSRGRLMKSRTRGGFAREKKRKVIHQNEHASREM